MGAHENEERCDCERHGSQRVVEEGSFAGFAGGRSYYVELACGCVLVDESNDVDAAM